MSRPACIASIVASIAALVVAAPASAAPSGRVVRIERADGGWIAPRLCEIHGDTGNCVGDQPRPGQTVVVLDERHPVIEVEIVEATGSASGCPNLWTVKTRALRGPVADGEGVGVIDPAVNPSRARVVDRSRVPASPSGQPGEEVWRAIDRDGDGQADILITRYSCDAQGKLVPSAPTYCIDVWARSGAKMVRTTQLNFAQCNL